MPACSHIGLMNCYFVGKFLKENHSEGKKMYYSLFTFLIVINVILFRYFCYLYFSFKPLVLDNCNVNYVFTQMALQVLSLQGTNEYEYSQNFQETFFCFYCYYYYYYLRYNYYNVINSINVSVATKYQNLSKYNHPKIVSK